MINITKGTNSDCKRLLRSTISSFTGVSSSPENKGKTYNMTFSVSLAQPWINVSPEGIKDALEKLSKVIANFSEQELLNVSMEITEHGSLEYHIASKAIDSYNASQSLEGLSSEKT